MTTPSNAQGIARSGVSANPWHEVIRRRWTRLQRLIVEEEYDLVWASSTAQRIQIEAMLRTLKRAALSVWLDARRENLELDVGHEAGRR